MSRGKCVKMGGHLVIIESAEEQAFLKNEINIKEGNDKSYWIGLTDQVEEGQFLWVDNRPLDPKNRFWDNGQPDKESEDCVQLGVDDKWDNWHDFSCEVERKRICEKTAELLLI
ncbi:C-type lectin domain family 4 member E-like [Erpetoichthys calabaricus]|uniref:C-type lectin domain family 4 member E-like n=1 Tax=Erpetoichthys calabaricus TaxID=27687 RepID=UPI002234C9A8|nr:C-type lectin domain family 4 member E-like [Erpetoichthys calabaricus]